MSDLISRAALAKNIRTIPDISGLCLEQVIAVRDVLEMIEHMPAVDAVPVVHGRWVKMTGMMPPEYHGHYECSECGWHMKGLRNSWTREEEMTYCPNCGAKMDGRDDE